MILLLLLGGNLLAYLYGVFIKPYKKNLNFKKKLLIVVTLIVFSLYSILLIISIDKISNKKTRVDITDLKVLSLNDFEKGAEEEAELNRDISLFIPKSYDYFSRNIDYLTIETEYSKALSEGIAKNLIDRYKNDSKRWFYGIDKIDLLMAFDQDKYNNSFEKHGFTEEDFNRLSLDYKDVDKAVEKAIEIMREKAVVQGDEKLWNGDQVYFLNYNKEEIVIRQGKEVIYIRGKDFGDPEIIKIVKDKLDLN